MSSKPLEVPQAIPLPDTLPLADWLAAVKEASSTLKVPLPRRQAAALRRLSVDLPATPQKPAGGR